MGFFNASPTTNRTITLQSQSPFVGNLLYAYSQTNGTAFYTNIPVGLVNGVILAPPARIPFQVQILPTDSGIVNASNRLASGSSSTFPAGQVAWAIATSDQRYALNGSSASNTFYPLFANPSNYTTLNLASNAFTTPAQVGTQIATSNLTYATTSYVASAVAPYTLTNAFVSGTNSLAGLIVASTNSPTFTRFGTNVITSVAVSQHSSVSSTTNSSGIAVTISVDTQTNGYGNIVTYNASNFSGTNINYNQITNPPALPTTNGFVTLTYLTNFNAQNYPTSNPSLFLTPVATNGLATQAYVLSVVASGTNSSSTNLTALIYLIGLNGTNFTLSTSNLLQILAFQQATNAAAAATNQIPNWLLSYVLTNQFISGTNSIYQANRTFSLTLASNATNNDTVVSNGVVSSATTIATTLTQASTNGMTSLVYTNPTTVLYTNSLPGLTNGYVKGSITNNLVSTNQFVAGTNNIATNSFAFTTNLVSTTSNSIIATVVGMTNSLVQGTNGTANALKIVNNLQFNNWTNFNLTTNLVGSFGSTTVPACNSTWENISSTMWTNRFYTNWNIQLTGGNYYMQSNGVSFFANTSLEGQWTLVVPFGSGTPPYSAYGSYWNMNGTKLVGNVYSTNLTAQFLSALASASLNTLQSNQTVSIVLTYLTSPTNGVSASTVSNIVNSTITVSNLANLTQVSNIVASLATTNSFSLTVVTNVAVYEATLIADNVTLGGILFGTPTNASFNTAGTNSVKVIATNVVQNASVGGVVQGVVTNETFSTAGTNAIIAISGSSTNSGNWIATQNGVGNNLTVTNPLTLVHAPYVASIFGPADIGFSANFYPSPVNYLGVPGNTFTNGDIVVFYNAATTNWIFTNGLATSVQTLNTPAIPTNGASYLVYTNGIPYVTGFTNFAIFTVPSPTVVLTADVNSNLNVSAGVVLNGQISVPTSTSQIIISNAGSAGVSGVYSSNSVTFEGLATWTLTPTNTLLNNFGIIALNSTNFESVFFTGISNVSIYYEATNGAVIPSNGSSYGSLGSADVFLFQGQPPNATFTFYLTNGTGGVVTKLNPVTLTVQPNSLPSIANNTNSSQLNISSGVNAGGNVNAHSFTADGVPLLVGYAPTNTPGTNGVGVDNDVINYFSGCDSAITNIAYNGGTVAPNPTFITSTDPNYFAHNPVPAGVVFWNKLGSGYGGTGFTLTYTYALYTGVIVSPPATPAQTISAMNVLVTGLKSDGTWTNDFDFSIPFADAGLPICDGNSLGRTNFTLAWQNGLTNAAQHTSLGVSNITGGYGWLNYNFIKSLTGASPSNFFFAAWIVVQTTNSTQPLLLLTDTNASPSVDIASMDWWAGGAPPYFSDGIGSTNHEALSAPIQTNDLYISINRSGTNQTATYGSLAFNEVVTNGFQSTNGLFFFGNILSNISSGTVAYLWGGHALTTNKQASVAARIAQFESNMGRIQGGSGPSGTTIASTTIALTNTQTGVTLGGTFTGTANLTNTTSALSAATNGLASNAGAATIANAQIAAKFGYVTLWHNGGQTAYADFNVASTNSAWGDTMDIHGVVNFSNTATLNGVTVNGGTLINWNTNTYGGTGEPIGIVGNWTIFNNLIGSNGYFHAGINQAFFGTDNTDGFQSITNPIFNNCDFWGDDNCIYLRHTNLCPNVFYPQANIVNCRFHTASSFWNANVTYLNWLINGGSADCTLLGTSQTNGATTLQGYTTASGAPSVGSVNAIRNFTIYFGTTNTPGIIRGIFTQGTASFPQTNYYENVTIFYESTNIAAGGAVKCGGGQSTFNNFTVYGLDNSPFLIDAGAGDLAFWNNVNLFPHASTNFQAQAGTGSTTVTLTGGNLSLSKIASNASKFFLAATLGESENYATNATLISGTSLQVNLPIAMTDTNYNVTAPNDLVGATVTSRTTTSFTLGFTAATLTSQTIEGMVIHQ